MNILTSLRFGVFTLLSFLFFAGCITTDNAFTRVAPGKWRGVLELEKFNIPVRDKDTIFTLKEQFREGELPFNFEVTYLDDERFYIEIINGSERIRCDSIRYGRDRTTARDTFNLYFPEYASYIHADVRGGVAVIHQRQIALPVQRKSRWTLTVEIKHRPDLCIAGHEVIAIRRCRGLH